MHEPIRVLSMDRLVQRGPRARLAGRLSDPNPCSSVCGYLKLTHHRASACRLRSQNDGVACQPNTMNPSWEDAEIFPWPSTMARAERRKAQQLREARLGAAPAGLSLQVQSTEIAGLWGARKNRHKTPGSEA